MDSNPITQTKHHARIALLAQYFLCGFIFSALLSRYPALKECYGMTMTQLSGVPLSMSIGSLCTMPLCVHLMARYGSKKMTMAGFIYISLLPLLSLVPNIISVYIVAFLYGCFISMFDVAMNGNSIIVENAYKKPIISMFHAFFYVGVCLSSILSVVLISNHVSIQQHHILMALFSLVILAFIRRYYLKETIKEPKIPAKKKILFPTGLLLLLAFVALCGRVVEGGVNNWSTVYMKMVVDFPENLAPLGLAIYSAFMSIGRFFCDYVRSKFRESHILLACCGISSLGISLMICNTSSVFAFVGLLIAGLGISCLVPIIYSLAGRQKNVTPAMGIAMVNTISGTGFLFGPFVIGILADHFGLRTSFFYIWCLTIVMIFLMNRYRRKEKEQ